MNPPRDWLRLTLVTLITGAAGVVLYLFAMDRDLNHDEHQFIAPGVLISREGLLPYRDFPMFHLPNLAFAYAALDRLTHEPIWGPKVLSALASTMVVLALLLVVSSPAEPRLGRRNLWLGLAIVALFLCDPLFTFTAGKTWNHEVPACLLTLAVVAQVTASSRGGWFLFAISGFLAGLSVGTRSTFAPVAMALGAFTLLAPLPLRSRLIGFGVWTVAAIVAMAPTWYFLIQDRDRFLFDNLQFPRLRLSDPTDSRAHKTAVWWRKYRFFAKEVLVRSIPVTCATLALAIPAVRLWLKSRRTVGYASAAPFLLLPALLIGCFLPSRFQYQHYFGILPLACLGLAYSVRHGLARWQAAILLIAAFVSAAGVTALDPGKKPTGIRAYTAIVTMLDRHEWFTERLREDYRIVRPNDKLLTLAPAPVLQAGARIYPELSTGPFAWRAAHLVAPESRTKRQLLAPSDLADFLKNKPPDAILTGVEDSELEKEFIAFAAANSFTPVKMGRQRILWQKPAPAPHSP